MMMKVRVKMKVFKQLKAKYTRLMHVPSRTAAVPQWRLLPLHAVTVVIFRCPNGRRVAHAMQLMAVWLPIRFPQFCQYSTAIC